MSIALAGCEGYLLWSYGYWFFKVIFMNPFISWGVITGILKVPETSSGQGMRPDCMSTSKYNVRVYECLSLTPHSVFFLRTVGTHAPSEEKHCSTSGNWVNLALLRFISPLGLWIAVYIQYSCPSYDIFKFIKDLQLPKFSIHPNSGFGWGLNHISAALAGLAPCMVHCLSGNSIQIRFRI